MNVCSIGRWLSSKVSYQPVLQTLSRRMATAGEGPSGGGGEKKMNRLALEKSPYLLQHAANPVDWYPWSEEAFNAARQENKLIFLSVGYSTCHWCHVMERESFENHDIAKIMNANFINVKVDREERPDVDKVYMTFVTASSGRGGWPMSVFLTPNLIPITGGTYFPPENRYGQMGFKTILESLSSKWQEDQEKFKESGKFILEVLDRTARLSAPDSSSIPGAEVIAKCYAQLARSYEPQYGGFSQSPKFPQPSNFNFMFTYFALHPELDDAKKGLEMALHSLRKMDNGGIHDHVSQGFARYSTDERWHVPHFEKMLYDQAQLTMSYLDAFVATGDVRFAEVVHDILTYVTRDLSHPSGGFYSAEDADSLPTQESQEKREGAFCVWTHKEISELLSTPLKEGQETTLANVFCHHYSIVEGGNVDPYKDPHDELKNQNVLMEHGTIEETAQQFNITKEECDVVLKKCRKILFDERQKRPRPHLDDKMVTAWNGMMLGAMARAGAVFKDEQYIQRALKAAEFVKTYLYKDGKLLRAAYTGPDNTISLGSCISGFVDDYAWVVRSFTYLYEATLDTAWLELAEELQDKQNDLFWDSEGKGYYMTETGDDSILLRIKEDQDGAEPSANSVSAFNLIRLSPLLERPDYREMAEAIFCLFTERLSKIPIALPEMATALLLHRCPPVQIILAVKNGTENLKDMVTTVHSLQIPNKVIMLADDNQESFMYSRHPTLCNYHPKSEETLAYVCQDFKCSLPVSKPDLLKDTLKMRGVAIL